MKKYFTHIKVILVLLVFSGLYVFAKHKNQSRKIGDVDVTFGENENLFLTHQTVDNLLIQKFNNVANQSKSSINLQEVEHTITAHPMVSKSDVSVGLDGGMKVRVQQREPIARLCSNSVICYLDKEGVQMPLSKNYSARVVVVDNKNGNIKTEEVLPLLKKIETTDFLKKSIVCIKKEKEGYRMLSRNNREWILLGKLNKLDDKLGNLKAFYSYFQDKEFKYKKIDLQYHNQVVCTK